MTQLPAYLQQYQAPDIGAALSANLGSAMPPHVSIGGGRFTLIDAGNNSRPARVNLIPAPVGPAQDVLGVSDEVFQRINIRFTERAADIAKLNNPESYKLAEIVPVMRIKTRHGAEHFFAYFL